MNVKNFKKINNLVYYFVVIFLFLIIILTYTTRLRYVVSPPAIDDIDPKVFYEEYTKNPENYIFLDVRPLTAYETLHAKGASLMELYTLYFNQNILPKNTNKEIILICSGGVTSGVAYGYLEHNGFRNIKRVLGGVENWKDEGLPVEGKAASLIYKK